MKALGEGDFYVKREPVVFMPLALSPHYRARCLPSRRGQAFSDAPVYNSRSVPENAG